MSDDPPVVLSLVSDVDLPDAKLRLFAAALTAPSSLLVLGLGDPGAVRTVFGLVGLLASIGWLATYRGANRRQGRVVATLTLRPEGFRWESDGTAIEQPYAEIADVDLEDDAASLVLVLRSGERIVLAPGYGGLGTVSLHRLIELHRHGANAARDG